MNRTGFLEAIRRDGETFRADRVSITTGSSELRGKGSMRVFNDSFILSVTLDDLANVPEPPNGIFGRSEFWEVRGIIDGELEFVIRDLPSGSSKHYGENPHATLTFSSNHLNLVPLGYDRLTRKEIEERHAQLIQSTSESLSVEPEVNPEDAGERQNRFKVTFYAILPDFEIMGRNGGTETIEKNDYLGEGSSSKLDTCYGKLPDWSFGLIQRGKDAHIYLRSHPKYDSASETEDSRRFRAFLNAIAFVHGKHAWPFLIEQRRNGRLVKDRIQLHGDVASTPHAPFDDKLHFNANVGTVDWSMEKALEAAYSFFVSDSKLAREATELLFQFREATKSGVPSRIGLLTLCSLLESLVRAIYEEQLEPLKVAERSAFNAAKRQVCQDLKLRAAGLPTEEAAAFLRIRSSVGEARLVNFRMIYDSTMVHLGFRSAERWKEIYDLWTSYRHPLAHRMTEGQDDEHSYKRDSLAESKIAGAINCILLKAMGYSGIAQSRSYPEEYIKL